MSVRQVTESDHALRASVRETIAAAVRPGSAFEPQTLAAFVCAALSGSLSADEAQLLPKIALQESASHFDLQQESTIPPDEAESRVSMRFDAESIETKQFPGLGDGARKLGELGASTQVYCGHEYTVKNLQFALTVEPDNQAAQRKIVWAQDERAAGRFTVPSTIGDEKTFNPFMRCHEKTVQQYVNATDEVEVMRKLRNAKDNFAGSSRPWSAPAPRSHPLRIITRSGSCTVCPVLALSPLPHVCHPLKKVVYHASCRAAHGHVHD